MKKKLPEFIKVDGKLCVPYAMDPFNAKPWSDELKAASDDQVRRLGIGPTPVPPSLYAKLVALQEAGA